jgi:hypothetical protein
MPSYTSSISVGIALTVIFFAMFWQVTKQEIQCKNNIELCSTFKQCAYYHFYLHFNDKYEIQANNLGICAKLLEHSL